MTDAATTSSDTPSYPQFNPFAALRSLPLLQNPNHGHELLLTPADEAVRGR